MSRTSSKPTSIKNSSHKHMQPNSPIPKRNALRNGEGSSAITDFSINSGSSTIITTKDQMIQRYYDLANQYREELKLRDQLKEQKHTIQADIASIFIQSDRLDELIQNVKDTKQPEASDED